MDPPVTGPCSADPRGVNAGLFPLARTSCRPRRVPFSFLADRAANPACSLLTGHDAGVACASMMDCPCPAGIRKRYASKVGFLRCEHEAT
jgi:hypothetical protein